MRVIHYPRVSSNQQVKEGDSIEVQIDIFDRFSKEKGHEVIAVKTDAGKSASISDDKWDIQTRDGKFIIKVDIKKRPALRWIIENADKDIFDAIIIKDWKRFSRNVIFSKITQIFLKDKGIEIIPTHDDTNPLTVDLKAVIAENDVKQIRDNVRLIRLKRFEEGVMVARAPYGYKFDKIKKKMFIDEVKAKKVRYMFNKTLQGETYKGICEVLNIKPGQYYNIIKNPTYAGFVQFEGKMKKGVHKPIIEVEVFEKINGKIEIT